LYCIVNGRVAGELKKCYATGRGIQPKGLRVGEDAEFKIFTEGAGAGNGEPRVMIMGPGGTPEKNTLKKVSGDRPYCLLIISSL